MRASQDQSGLLALALWLRVDLSSINHINPLYAFRNGGQHDTLNAHHDTRQGVSNVNLTNTHPKTDGDLKSTLMVAEMLDQEDRQISNTYVI
ncbi:hypothetical protein [Leptothrix ochracea]|uniref:hypothetical protein n=1 Tax=Leptothrix ochracea TaxID=735331 RepID=UPI0034E1AB96